MEGVLPSGIKGYGNFSGCGQLSLRSDQAVPHNSNAAEDGDASPFEKSPSVMFCLHCMPVDLQTY